MNLSPNAINSVQQQQAWVYFQQPNGQNFQGQVSQIFHFDGAAAVSWPGASTIDVQGVAELQPANAIQLQEFAVACLQEVQVQDGQAQKIISDDRTFHRRELSPNTLVSCAVSSTSSHQQTPLFSCIQTVGAGAQESSYQLQKDCNDNEKWQVLASATNPATVRTPIRHSQISEFNTPNLAIFATSTTSTSAQSSSSLNALRMRMRIEGCPCPNCDDEDENFLLNIEKGQNIASATNPATASTHIQHSQVPESVTPNLATAATSTTSTSAQSSSALNALRMRMRIEACPCPNCDDQDENFILNIEKGQDIASATNPATVSTPIQHSQVSESVTPNLAISATSRTSTSAESQSSNSALNAPRLRMRKEASKPSPNCNDQDGSNKNSKKKVLPCITPGCSKVFGKFSDLRVHYRYHTGYHIDERPFVCSWTSCGKKFFRFHHLEIHQRTHADEKKFQCSECFRSFTQKSSLSSHLKIYHVKGTLQLQT